MKFKKNRAEAMANSAMELMDAGTSQQNRRLVLKGARRMRRAAKMTWSRRERGEMLTNVAVSLIDAFEFGGHTPDLAAAITTLRRGMRLLSDRHSDYVIAQSSLAVALQHLSEKQHSPRTARKALRLARAAAGSCPPTHAHWETCQTNLSSALDLCHRYGGDDDLLTEAIEVRKNVALLSSSPRSGASWTVLGTLFHKRYSIDKRNEDLDNAVDAHQHAVDAAHYEQRDLSTALSNLGSALRQRHLALRITEDAVEAVAKHREAVAITPSRDPELPRRLSNLATSLMTAHETALPEFETKEAIDCLRIALSKSPGPALTFQLHGNLGNAFSVRFDETNDSRDARRAVRQLKAAQRGFRRLALAEAGLQCSLGEAYADLYSVTGSTRYARRSIRWHRKALAAATNGGGPRLLLRLADALMLIHEGRARHLDEAADLYLQAALSKTATAHEKAIGWYRYGRVLVSRRGLAIASIPWINSIDNMRITVPHWLPLRDAQLLTKDATGVATEAVAASLAAGNSRRALEVAEKARVVLLGHRLDDPDIRRLRRELPELAAQMDKARRQLNAGYFMR